MCEHDKHKVNETHKRSIAKGITGRIIEIAVDTALLSFIGVHPAESLAISIGIEILCFCSCYLNERLWNRSMWGRRIEHD
jgi:hypothetical protein